MPAARRYLWVALAAILSACSKSEPPAPRAQPQPAVPSAPAAPAKSGGIDDGLKERLARQEAAARMFESKVLNPPPPASATPAPPPPASASPEPPRVEAPKPELKATSPKAESAKSEPARAEAPKPQAQPQPSAAPRTDLAAARPSAAPEAVPTKLVSRVDPEFPRKAASSGYENGNVKARMTLDASGNVTRVEILAANPRRVFDRAVVRALSQWRYNEGAAGRTVDMEVEFRR